MKFKKTIAAVALTASSAFALTAPFTETKTICLDTREGVHGALHAGRCDQSRNNKTLNLDILENGCAENQIALTTGRYSTTGKFDIEVYYCLPPNVVQL